jgi:iron complex transport system permease protein
MTLSSDSVLNAYRADLRRKARLFVLGALLLILLALVAVAVGSYDLTPGMVLRAVLAQTGGAIHTVVWNIRLPRIAAAVVSGWGLALSGLAFQSLLRNPLASPSTLGISHGAAFGAALAIVLLGAGGLQLSALRTGAPGSFHMYRPYAVTLFAFGGAMAATLTIVALARIKKLSSGAIILAGVALSSLFVSGTILIQYLASEVEIAAVVFWTFGDVARSTWKETGILTAVSILITLYFFWKRWDLNALTSGDDMARGLGVEVEKIRIRGLLLATVVTALVTCFHGVIAFLGLLAPHIGRRLVGSDHRFLLWHSCLVGSFLLLLADTCGRLMVGSGTLPVGVLTSFMGAPLFLYLLVRGNPR